jgi:vanillate O-demethylase ferredoxin subunit
VETPSGEIRQYSLCGDPQNNELLTIAIKREDESRGGSESMHASVQVGDFIKISDARCHFKLSNEADRHILIGAGIGITPLLSMAYQCEREKTPYQLHYFTRSKDHAAFVELLSQSPFKDNFFLHVVASRYEINSPLEAILKKADSGNNVYTCGPSSFMDTVVELGSQYIPERQIHLEAFQAKEIKDQANYPFRVKLASSDTTCEVVEDETLIIALEKLGIDIPTSCCEGVCGTCLIPVISGDIDHRDSFLTKEEIEDGDMMCACVSRSAKGGELILDM